MTEIEILGHIFCSDLDMKVKVTSRLPVKRGSDTIRNIGGAPRHFFVPNLTWHLALLPLTTTRSCLPQSSLIPPSCHHQYPLFRAPSFHLLSLAFIPYAFLPSALLSLCHGSPSLLPKGRPNSFLPFSFFLIPFALLPFTLLPFALLPFPSPS